MQKVAFILFNYTVSFLSQVGMYCPHIQKHAILPGSLGGNFFGRKKREEKEEIFEKLLLNFERFFWNKDKLIEEIFEENVSIV